jgi:hypothetical protein
MGIMATYRLRMIGKDSDGSDVYIGTLNFNFPPRGMASWSIQSMYVALGLSGKWVVGHAIGKSPQDTYCNDGNGSQVLMVASFIPMNDFSVGWSGSGRFFKTDLPLNSTAFDFRLDEKDGRTAMLDDSSSSDDSGSAYA